MYTGKKKGDFVKGIIAVYRSLDAEIKKAAVAVGKSIDFEQQQEPRNLDLRQNPMIATPPPAILVHWKITLKERKGKWLWEQGSTKKWSRSS